MTSAFYPGSFLAFCIACHACPCRLWCSVGQACQISFGSLPLHQNYTGITVPTLSTQPSTAASLCKSHPSHVTRPPACTNTSQLWTGGRFPTIVPQQLLPATNIRILSARRDACSAIVGTLWSRISPPLKTKSLLSVQASALSISHFLSRSPLLCRASLWPVLQSSRPPYIIPRVTAIVLEKSSGQTKTESYQLRSWSSIQPVVCEAENVGATAVCNSSTSRVPRGSPRRCAYTVRTVKELNRRGEDREPCSAYMRL